MSRCDEVSGTRTITGMDVCIRKPLIVTCGADESVRVWNYLNKSMDLTAYFEEDPTSCAMHPSCLHVLVGFTDKLRLMNLLLDDIRPCREFSVKSCVDCTFSKGGHLFAATTGNAINIYDYYTFECIAQLRGHIAELEEAHAARRNRAAEAHLCRRKCEGSESPQSAQRSASAS